MKRSLSLLVAASLVVLANVVGANAAPTTPSKGEYRPDLKAGDVLSKGPMSIEVPRPGFSVFGEALLPDGSTESVEVTTDSDGDVL